MSEAQAQGQANATAQPEATQSDGTQVEQQDSTLTREDHIRELQRVGKKEKTEGQQKAINDLLEKTGAESIDDVLSGYEEYKGIREAVETEADKQAKRADKLEARAKAAEERYTGTLKTYALRDALRDAGINPERLKGAMRLADASALKVDGEGDVSGVEEVVEAVREEAPEFFGSFAAERPRVNAPQTNGSGRSTSGVSVEQSWADDLINILEQQSH